MKYLLCFCFIISGSLLYFMIRFFFQKKYWISLFAIWSIITYFVWNEYNHLNDYVVLIPNQTHITYKVFFGKDQYIVRHPISWNGSQWVNQDWSVEHCCAIYQDDEHGWVFKLDGNFVSNNYLFFHHGICNMVQSYIDDRDAKQRLAEWNKK